jgi:hypothetical protein
MTQIIAEPAVPQVVLTREFAALASWCSAHIPIRGCWSSGSGRAH